MTAPKAPRRTSATRVPRCASETTADDGTKTRKHNDGERDDGKRDDGTKTRKLDNGTETRKC